MKSLETVLFDFVVQFHVGSKEDGGASWLVKGIKPLNARSILLDLRVAASSAIDKWFQDTLRRCVFVCEVAIHVVMTWFFALLFVCT